MNPARTAAVLVAASSCLLAAACTSSNQTAPRTATAPPASTSATGRSIGKSSFTDRASAVCDRSNQQLGAAARHAFGNRRPTPTTWRTFMLSTALPIITHRLDTLASLPQPDRDPSSVAVILSAGRSAVTAARNNPRLLSPASPAPFGQFDHLTTAYGIPTCAVGG
ncbi:MAG TPA: hypothetical protein VKB75_13355 [Jatrophihabitans sp.]|nr:hypothetical protein [Jatrophihabitans sp.]